MARADIDPILLRVDHLAEEINKFVPADPRAIQFRADLAGLLVVAIAATYESCVKETLMNYASRHHAQFGTFARNNYERLNSRIAISDLYKLARTFDNGVHSKFVDLLKARKSMILGRKGLDISKSYEQILSWRHDFAHAGIKNTTVEEALAVHRFAKRVLYSFDKAFE